MLTEPDYRAMWRELQARVDALEEQASSATFVNHEQWAAAEAKEAAFERVLGLMADDACLQGVDR